MSSDCPRCGAVLGVWNADKEPTCTICGWVDYSLPLLPPPIRSLLTGPHGYLVPYLGTTDCLTAVEVKVVFRRGRVRPTPICPYDGERMISVGFKGTKRQSHDNRSQFQCLENRHRIVLERDSSGEAVGWL